MPGIGARTLVLLAVLPVLGCNGCPVKDSDDPCVLVLVVDGVRTTEFTSTSTSPLTGEAGEDWAPRTWATLAPDAASVRSALITGTTLTAPSHAQILTGRLEPYANFPVFERDVGLYYPSHPTLFEEARHQLDLSGDGVVLVANTELLEGVTRSLYPGLSGGARYDLIQSADGLPSSDDTDMFEALEAILEDGPPRVLVANIHDIDRSAHFGPDEAYVDGITKVDRLIETFRDWLEDRHPIYAEHAMIVVTSDHGRHNTGEDEDWRSHGDACSGCREVPMFVLGGGARAGEIVEGSIIGLDLAPTLAAHLGIDLPFGEGLPLSTLVDGLDGSTRRGDVDVTASGELVATRRWLYDLDARSEVRVGADVLSTPGVFAAEAPSVLSGAADWACFREIDLTPGEPGWPWRPRCLRRGDDEGWEDIGFATDDGGPQFRMSMIERGGGIWAAWPSNPHAIAELGSENDVGLAVAAWTPDGGWSGIAVLEAYFPTDLSLVATGSNAVAAFATNHGGNEARNSRRVWVAPITFSGGAPVADEVVEFTLAELLGEPARVERPVLGTVDDTLWLAMQGFDADGGRVAVASSEDGGASWSDVVALPTEGELLPNVSPAWDGDFCVWAALVDGDAALCRARPADAAAECVGVGSSRIDSFAVAGGVATVARDAGVADWEIASIVW